MRILVVTVVHTPLDARIHRRQVGALCAAGHDVVLAAPWRAHGLDPTVAGELDPATDAAVDRPGRVRGLDLPRAQGRRRTRALVAAARLLRRHAAEADVVLLHDPELLAIAWLVPPGTAVVFDVHEDAVAAMVDRAWLPPPVRRPVGAALRWLERVAERRYHLLLAEEGYAHRFVTGHPVVRNVPPVPAALPTAEVRPAAVYVGRISRLRGAHELIALGRRLAAGGIHLDVVGAADVDVRAALDAADAAGELRFHGFLPNEQALALVDGALAGISLLHDVPNYRVSAPTKVYEYLSRGVPVVTTPLPIPRRVVEEHEVGRVIAFGDVEGAATAIEQLRADPQLRARLGARAHAVAAERFDWHRDAERFVGRLEDWARQAAA